MTGLFPGSIALGSSYTGASRTELPSMGFWGWGLPPGNFQRQVSTELTTLSLISPQMVQGALEAHVRLDRQHG